MKFPVAPESIVAKALCPLTIHLTFRIGADDVKASMLLSSFGPPLPLERCLFPIVRNQIVDAVLLGIVVLVGIRFVTGIPRVSLCVLSVCRPG